MQKDFWLSRWHNNEIGFHNNDVNPLLVEYLPRLSLPSSSRLLLPLCGKSRDIAWLLSEGFAVLGVELSELAVTQLFAELNLTPSLEQKPHCKIFSAENLIILVADIFELRAADIGAVDGIYDRAALVALPPDMRGRYAKHLADISRCPPQLLVSFDYRQAAMPGPPFSVPEAELKRLYSGRYQLQRLASSALEGGLKGKCEALEQVWLLQPKRETR
ncbi:thiopurine S-methyltransferase [Simiduia curdlanivorans]|uniref:Thiopurine S-methyltransferase n=1 Tax=Simiduia curdlanivorans TaxID=1492769 RepID=A0ABV8V072_9GAMM|nr:thiopurine S-methyltransferase [Simiduia curdlanivorans]MDN3637827.1 thiopurine S-methyltransferase [Simiduia curdlanivorans]